MCGAVWHRLAARSPPADTKGRCELTSNVTPIPICLQLLQAQAAYGNVDVYTSSFRPMRNTIRWVALPVAVQQQRMHVRMRMAGRAVQLMPLLCQLSTWCCPLTLPTSLLILCTQRQRGPDIHEAAGGGGHRRGGGLPHGEPCGLQYGMHTQPMQRGRCAAGQSAGIAPRWPTANERAVRGPIDSLVACLVLLCRWAPTRRRSCRASAWR